MAIAEMLKVALVGMKEDARSMTELLQRSGAVHIESPNSDDMAGRRLDRALDFQTGIFAYENRVQDMKSVLDFMDKHRPVKKSFSASFIGWHYRIGEREYGSYAASDEVTTHKLAAEAASLEERINGLNEKIRAAGQEIESLTPWVSIDAAPADFSRLRSASLLLFTKEKSRKEADIAEALAVVRHCSAWVRAGEDEKNIYCAVISLKTEEQKVTEAMAAAGFLRVPTPELDVLPSKRIEELKKGLASLNDQLANLMKEAGEFCGNRAAAFSLYDHFANKKAQLETASNFISTDSAFVLEGWIRKDAAARFEERLRKDLPGVALLTREPSPDEDVPVDLDNKGVFFPFEAVTRIMGLPRQGSIDPTPLLAVFFFIYFGTCMGDAIYGLILMFAGLYMIRKMKTAGMGTMLLQLMVAGGVATVLFGVLTGGYFGDLFAKWIKPLWFDPMSENGPLIFLGYSFGMGVVQILFGMGIKAWDNVRNGRWLSAIYDQGFWVLLLLGVGLLIGGGSLGPGFAQAGKYIAIAGAAGLVLTQGRHQPNVVLKLGSGIVSLYNITAYMSDIVSYSRLFGLGFTSIVIGMVINYMAKMLLDIPVVGYVLFLVVLVFGHLFNLLINVTSAFIHSARLQYVEFFGKFADFGGTKFEPFRVSNKYVDIDVEEAK